MSGEWFRKETKDNIKKAVKNHELKIIIGTDAASEGLNLSNPFNSNQYRLTMEPNTTRAEKVENPKNWAMSDKILIYNMRYKDSVEDKVHKKLSDRLKNIHEIFGQIPEVLEDVWIANGTAR